MNNKLSINAIKRRQNNVLDQALNYLEKYVVD